MSNIFLQLFNISIMASWLILIIIILRSVFKDLPKKVIRYLWLVVGLRLILPFSFETGFSLIPSSKTIIVPNDSIPVINTGFEMIDNNANLLLENNIANKMDVSTLFNTILDLSFIVWIIGAIFIILYGVVCYKRVKQSIEISVNHHDNVFICDDIDTPFILGLQEPKIYLPSTINETQMRYILEHESIHIEYKDHIWKPLGYVLLSVYWFNPIIWVAYILLCRDIESACDERVVEKIGVQLKPEYSETLLYCSTDKKMLLACPVAFGEVRVKERIQDILNYSTPKKWIKRVSIAICLVLSFGFLTDPYALYNVKVVDYESSTYTEDEIEDGIRTVYKNFKTHFGGCTLTEIEYAGDRTSLNYQEWATRHNADEVMVFHITFETDSNGGFDKVFNSNDTYTGFSQILVRKHGSKWRVVDGGYG